MSLPTITYEAIEMNAKIFFTFIFIVVNAFKTKKNEP